MSPEFVGFSGGAKLPTMYRVPGIHAGYLKEMRDAVALWETHLFSIIKLSQGEGRSPTVGAVGVRNDQLFIVPPEFFIDHLVT